MTFNNCFNNLQVDENLPLQVPILRRQLNVAATSNSHAEGYLRQGVSIEETIQHVKFCKQISDEKATEIVHMANTVLQDLNPNN